MQLENFIEIDGIPVKIEGERNLLEVISKSGVKLPVFCYHSDLSIYGACRMCMVEDEKGRMMAACSTVPRAGMIIRTNTSRLCKYRKSILELLLASHCRDCTTCQHSGSCTLQELAVQFGNRHSPTVIAAAITSQRNGVQNAGRKNCYLLHGTRY